MPPTPTALRGTALIAAVIDRVEKGRSSLPIHQLRPVPPGALAALTLPNGAPLPPSLRMWLAYDASFLMRTARWFRHADQPSLPGLSFAALVAEELGARGPELEELGASVLPATCVRLTSGDSSFSFLYLGQPDAAGEYPVLVADVNDQPVVELEQPGFDVWLACQAGLLTASKAATTYKLALAEQAHRNLGGCLSYESLNGWKGRKVKRPPAASATLDAALPETKAPVLAKTKRKGPLLPGQEPTTVAAVLGLLEEAAVLGEDERLPWLKTCAARVSSGGAGFAAAMYDAVRRDRLALVRCLLELGVPVDHRNEGDPQPFTPLYVASLNGHDALVRFLLAQGADPNARSGDEKQTPLHIAVSNVPQRVDLHASGAVVRALVAAGADVEAETRHGMRPLVLAAAAAMPFSDADTVVALLEAKARVDVTCAGAGVLWWAIQGFGRKGGSAAAVRALLAAGADADEVTDASTPPRRVAPLALAFEQLSTKYTTDASGILKALVAGGADRAKAGLEGALAPDGSLRTALSIAYRSSEQPQDVLLRVLLAGWTGKEGVRKAVAQLVARLNEAAAGERVAIVTRPDAWLDARFDHTLRVSAVPPALLREALAQLVEDLQGDRPVTGIELKGALAPDGSADSLVVREDGARSHMPEHVRSRYA